MVKDRLWVNFSGVEAGKEETEDVEGVCETSQSCWKTLKSVSLLGSEEANLTVQLKGLEGGLWSQIMYSSKPSSATY